MNRLERTTRKPKARKQIQQIAKDRGVTYKSVKDSFAADADAEMWINDLYVVTVNRQKSEKTGFNSVWLSMRRVDREPITDWRHKQEIKNQLIGPECEAVELYPAESRLVDTANQFHLWGIDDPTLRFPLGMNDGRKVDDLETGGSRQRPTEK